MAKIDEHIKVMMLKGETGSNIKSIDKTATSGLVDTYTVTLTDGTKSNFTVTNGKDGADGKDFDTFEIGGRNLLRGSKDFSGATLKAPTATYSTETVSGVGCTVLSVDNSAGSENAYPAMWLLPGLGTAGAVYTASFWFKGSGECSMAFSGIGGYTQVAKSVMTINGTTTTTTSEDGKVIFIASGSTVSDWTRCTVVYALSNAVGSTTDKHLTFCAAAGATLSIALPMLERSTKPSDWMPSPEDKADASALAEKADVSAIADKADLSAIVPKSSVESSAAALHAYAPGGYVLADGVLRKVKSAIAQGNAIDDSNSAATTVAGELVSLANAVDETTKWHHMYDTDTWGVYYTKRHDVLYIRVHVGGLTTEWWKAGTLPEGYRPKMDFYAPMQVSENACAGLYVGHDGEVSMESHQSNASTAAWTIVSIPLW